MKTLGPFRYSFVVLFCLTWAARVQPVPAGLAIDAEVAGIMTQTHANGMAVAVIDHGRVRSVQSYGIRNTGKDPLTTDGGTNNGRTCARG